MNEWISFLQLPNDEDVVRIARNILRMQTNSTVIIFWIALRIINVSYNLQKINLIIPVLGQEYMVHSMES